ncbi:leucine-rich repeat-containing protein [Elysia marginata]|uniref:Leucine-rich repeat-containing protein n=1 Tax=Elysia marginata TaxID=1093978 RepID=A0AAV4HIR2_9GAST|nr:leucine-rich repeat-containing protein [Elysia marginata]
MEGSRRTHVAETKKIQRKTKEKTDISLPISLDKEPAGILKKKEEPELGILRDSSNTNASDENRVMDRIASGKTVHISETRQDEADVNLDTDVVGQANNGQTEQKELNSGRGSNSDNFSDSELSEDEQQDRHVVDSDYDTDLEMNDHKWLYPEKYEHDTTGKAKYIKACQDEGVQPVRTFLNNMQEEHLQLKHHGLGPKAMKALSTPLENLSENKIGNEGAVLVCNLLSSNRHIDHVNLAGNEIGNPTVENFYNVLTQPGTVLKHLNLRHNNFDDGSAQRFKEALIENETLEFLDLGWNNFQSKGCVLLAEGLKENVGLKELAVSMNGFGLEGGKALGKALQANRTLYKLDASYCRLPIECTKDIALGLMNNDKLGVLDISYNSMDAESALVILLGLQQNDSSELLFFELGNTRVSLKFKEVGDKLSEERGLVIQHGGVSEDYKTQITELDPMEAFKRDPMTKLKEWLANAGYRLIDLMRTFDKDQSMTISIREFREGIASTKIPLTEEQLQILINKLDKDGDGEIDFSELVDGDKTHRQNKREIDKYVKEKEQKAKEQAKQEKLAMESSKKKDKKAKEKEKQEEEVLEDPTME